MAAFGGDRGGVEVGGTGVCLPTAISSVPVTGPPT